MRRRRQGVATALVVAALTTTLGACGGPKGSGGPGPGEGRPAATGSAPASERAGDPAEPARRPLRAPLLARTADDLAARLVAAEDVVRDPAARSALQQAAFEAQVLHRQLARTPRWHDRVLRASGPYRATFADHIEARTALRSVLTTLSDELPAWRIVSPTPLRELRRYYREGERVHGVPWQVLAAVNLVETGFAKIRGYSSAGARGPMQFIAPTWEAYGEGDIDDPHDSILAAARYLAANGGGSPAGLDGALHAYNRHTGYVRGVRAYARILERDPAALPGLHQWQIIYLSERGDLWLPRGYRQRTSLPVRAYLRQHPDRLLSPATD